MSAYRKARWMSIIIALSGSLPMACQALILWYGGQLLASREYGILQFFVCYQAVMSGAESAGAGFSFGPNAAQATAAANRILSITERRGEHSKAVLPGQEGEDHGRIPDSDGSVKIEFKDVAFKYPTRDIPILKQLNITVEKGQFAALVGASGAGKSSIVALLERFYEIQQGSIMCNGRDIRSVDVYEYRKLLSLVAQEATLFQGNTFTFLRVSFRVGSLTTGCAKEPSGKTYSLECLMNRPSRTPSSTKLAETLRSTTSSCRYQMGTIPTSVPAEWHCPAGRNSGYPSPGPSSVTRKCCCWTKRHPHWTRRARSRSLLRCRKSRRGGPLWQWLIACQQYSMQT